MSFQDLASFFSHGSVARIVHFKGIGGNVIGRLSSRAFGHVLHVFGFLFQLLYLRHSRATPSSYGKRAVLQWGERAHGNSYHRSIVTFTVPTLFTNGLFDSTIVGFSFFRPRSFQGVIRGAGSLVGQIGSHCFGVQGYSFRQGQQGPNANSRITGHRNFYLGVFSNRYQGREVMGILRVSFVFLNGHHRVSILIRNSRVFVVVHGLLRLVIT